MTRYGLGLFVLAFQGVGAADKHISNVHWEDIDSSDEVPVDKTWERTLHTCTGATCGVWGDPHMSTCDGRRFDCQGKGIFQLHKSPLFDIQAHFVDVGKKENEIAEEHRLTQGASMTNDIAIKYTGYQSEDYEVVQFGFGNLTMHDTREPFWAEVGCTSGDKWHPLNGFGWPTSYTFAETVNDCRKYCEEHVDIGCAKFSWFTNGGCHITTADAELVITPSRWARSTSGTLDSECGNPPEPDPQSPEVGWIYKKCPLLVIVDGEMIDTSAGNRKYVHKRKGANTLTPIYGTKDDKVYIENMNNEAVRVYYTLPSGEVSYHIGIVKGEGPGKLWGCHWDFYSCFPEQNKTDLEFSSLGLYGTPNDNLTDEFMNRQGETIILENTANDWHKTTLDYCYQNWCVPEDESIFTYYEGAEYLNWKCGEYEQFIFSDETCVIPVVDIAAACIEDEEGNPLTEDMRRACEIDCCEGGCPDIHDVIHEVEDMLGDPVTVTVNEDGEDDEDEDDEEVLFDEHVIVPPSCDKGQFLNTARDVCPGTPVVKHVSSKGADPLPDYTVFYGLVLDAGDDIHERTVKFKVANPFEGTADVYVRYDEKKVATWMDAACVELPDIDGTCNNDAVEIEAGCHDFGGHPIAFVQVYFAAEGIGIDDESIVHKCCHPPEFSASTGVVSYTFEIHCTCPSANGATEEAEQSSTR